MSVTLLELSDVELEDSDFSFLLDFSFLTSSWNFSSIVRSSSALLTLAIEFESGGKVEDFSKSPLLKLGRSETSF